ncbi:MAG: radical SAM protein [Chloroflexi bacterium]|nr:radical SAM protein [Chloroflexota bacterium]
MTLRMHHFLPRSRANGPGWRAVLWVQGCSLGCPGCFNPETHAFDAGEVLSVDRLFQRIEALGDSVEGLTVSGGEPFQQLRPLTALLRHVRAETPLSIIVFTGFAWEEVRRMDRSSPLSRGTRLVQPDLLTDHSSRSGDFPVAEIGRLESCLSELKSAIRNPQSEKRRGGPEVLDYVDVLIAGGYDETRRIARGLRGSANKTVHLLTSRYTLDDLQQVPEAEVILTPAGDALMSGIEPLQWPAEKEGDSNDI